MANARRDFEWSQTASIMSVILNLMKGKNDKMVTPSDIMDKVSGKAKRSDIPLPAPISALKSLIRSK